MTAFPVLGHWLALRVRLLGIYIQGVRYRDIRIIWQDSKYADPTMMNSWSMQWFLGKIGDCFHQSFLNRNNAFIMHLYIILCGSSYLPKTFRILQISSLFKFSSLTSLYGFLATDTKCRPFSCCFHTASLGREANLALQFLMNPAGSTGDKNTELSSPWTSELAVPSQYKE